MRISDWSSDVCSSDLLAEIFRLRAVGPVVREDDDGLDPGAVGAGQHAALGAGPDERIACVMRRVRVRGLRVCGGPAAANATTAIRRMTGCVFMASGLFSKNACAETILDGKASIRAPTNEGTGENERRSEKPTSE